MAFDEHKPVLLDEVLQFARLHPIKSYVDLTLGRGGHAKKILSIMPPNSTFVGVDRDKNAIDYCQKHLLVENNKCNYYFLRSKFSNAIETIKRSAILSSSDFILMDIGVSSPQFDDPERGFSYRYDTKLDMRMDQSQYLTAEMVVNEYSEEELIHVFRDLGQCKIYYSIVKAILNRRQEKRIETTGELVDIIKENLPSKELHKEGHPAKQFFLGLRYAVNDEISELQNCLKQACDFLNPGGRLVVISFNSEEDQIVKRQFKELAEKKHKDKYDKKNEDGEFITLTKKPITPTEEEIEENNRSKSAILRCLERRLK